MTIVVVVKVNEGVVLAADSVTTQAPERVYQGGEKVFQLSAGIPIGGVTWGHGAIGTRHISTLMKDLRERFLGGETQWRLDPQKTTMDQAAGLVRKFVFEETYQKDNETATKKPYLGLLVAGYSPGQARAEVWRIEVHEGNCSPPALALDKNRSDYIWHGQPEVLNRLLLGYDTRLAELLRARGVDKVKEIMEEERVKLEPPLYTDMMPIWDAVCMAEYLVQTVIGYYRFSSGLPVVGGAIDIATITKHEGFRWVRSKRRFDLRPSQES